MLNTYDFSDVINEFQRYILNIDKGEKIDLREYLNGWIHVLANIQNVIPDHDPEAARHCDLYMDAIRRVARSFESGGKFDVIMTTVDTNSFQRLILPYTIEVFAAVTVELDEFLHNSGEILGTSPRKIPIYDSSYYMLRRTQYVVQRDQRREAEITLTDSRLFNEAVSKEFSIRLRPEILQRIDSEAKIISNGLMDQNNQKIDAFLLAQSDLAKISKPVELWASAAQRHRKNFRNGLSSITIIIAIFAVAASLFISKIQSALGFVAVSGDKIESFTPAATLSLAIIISIITAVGYVLKLAGRVVTNSLTLAEDAEIRSALADTYLGLTTEEKSSTTDAQDKARTVMLAALFRPLPGYQQEEIVAPTVISLAQDMLGKKTPT